MTWSYFKNEGDDALTMLTQIKKIIPLITAFTLTGTQAVAEPVLKPAQVQLSDLNVQVEHLGTMPFTGRHNLGSPVVIKNSLYVIDQKDAIYEISKQGSVQMVFNVTEAPDGLVLDRRESILNISPGRTNSSIFVMLTSSSEPTTVMPVYRLPDPLPGYCCSLDVPVSVDDLYRYYTTEYQVLYEYKLAGNRFKNPRAIAAFETQSSPAHHGGGLLTLPDGRILFATGDALPHGTDGRSAPQDPVEHVGKIIIINPDDGSIEIAAQGVRNVQHLEYVLSNSTNSFLIGFADIGGVTAEEVNYISAEDLIDTTEIENFGWGRNANDGLAREGTFYVGEGIARVNTHPSVEGMAPTPEAGFIQPQAQYGRHDPNGGVAVSGPVTSTSSFNIISAVFSDLSSGILYATIDSLDSTDATVYRVNLFDKNSLALDSFRDLASGRADPRLFRFPDGTAGVLLEATGNYYRLTEIE